MFGAPGDVEQGCGCVLWLALLLTIGMCQDQESGPSTEIWMIRDPDTECGGRGSIVMCLEVLINYFKTRNYLV